MLVLKYMGRVWVSGSLPTLKLRQAGEFRVSGCRAYDRLLVIGYSLFVIRY